MKALVTFALLLFILQYRTWALSPEQVSKELGPQLSRSAVISGWDAAKYGRWSEYHALEPGVVVIPANEQDVAATVRCYSTATKPCPLLIRYAAIGRILHLKGHSIPNPEWRARVGKDAAY